YVLGLFALVYTVHCLAGECPSTPIQLPCRYSLINDKCGVFCEGEVATNLTLIFTELAQKLPADQKQFGVFWVGRTNVTELPANVFAGLQFNLIQIQANKLQRIYRHAFNGTDTSTTEQYISDAPVNERVDREWDLFGAIHTLQALNVLHIENTSVRSLPTRAISGHKQLKWLNIVNNPIHTIATHAFNDLPSLIDMSVSHSPIESVAKRAFTVGNGASDQRIGLDLIGDSLTDKSFADKAFDDMKCAVILTLMDNSVRYLNLNVFKGFLSDNPNNTIVDRAVDCNNSRNEWIKKQFPTSNYNYRLTDRPNHRPRSDPMNTTYSSNDIFNDISYTISGSDGKPVIRSTKFSDCRWAKHFQRFKAYRLIQLAHVRASQLRAVRHINHK
ncbi:unnamed protein product, partial [Medioppia subpectinata]